MKGLRGLFKLGTLTLLALTLMGVLTLPSAADSHQVCSSSLMLPEVEIASVEAKPSSVHWRPQDLVKFKYNGDIENGLLEVRFKDIATDFDFDGYIIKAVPGNDDPGDSADRGVGAYTSSSLIPRPAIIGNEISEVLNLEPGTKYYVTVHAVNHNTVQISPKQRAQDSAQSSATTLLSAPFLGALHARFEQYNFGTNSWGSRCNPLGVGSLSNPCWFHRWVDVGLDDDMNNDFNSDYEGTHFALYDADNEAGQHYFRWLNPANYGPYDHIRDDVLDYLNGDDDSEGQADMLSLDKDGKVEDHCAGDAFDNGDCGHTHYQFTAVDANGKTVASELVETGGNLVYSRSDSATEDVGREDNYFEVVFTAESGELTLSVSLGRVDGGKYRAMSDTASVTFDAPGDLRAFDQTPEEYDTVLHDIDHLFYDNLIYEDNPNGKGNEIAGRWLGEKGSGAGRSLWNPRAEESLLDMYYGPLGATFAIQAYLNNQLK